MKLASFDLEINKPIPEGTDDWKTLMPLGISCASIAWRDDESGDRGIQTYYSPDTSPLSAPGLSDIVDRLGNLMDLGYDLVGFNSCGFDMHILAQESNNYKMCVDIAQNHIDMMLMVVAFRGHRLSLEKMARGAGLEGKQKRVQLNSGLWMENMNGAVVPLMWQDGEFDAVLDYQEQDALLTLNLARHIAKTKTIRWIAGSGNENIIDVPGLMTVEECSMHRENFPAWKTDPDLVVNYTKWMTEYLAQDEESIPW